jgi:hypothetical protein
MLALAAWQTGETKSFKSALEGNKEVVKVLEKQRSSLVIAQQKNDDLQGELNDIIKAAADFTTLKDNLTKLVTKYKNQNAAKSELAQNSKPQGNGATQ